MQTIRIGAFCALVMATMFFSVHPRPAHAASSLELLSVDATDAPRQVWHAKLHVPVAGGDTVLVYPKWIPGAHGPVGPIANLATLKAASGGVNVPWVRDPNDVYAFHFAVPSGARTLDLTYDYFEGGAGNGNMTAELAVLDWNNVVLYPKGATNREVSVKADITLPSDWTEATALPLATPAKFSMPSGNVTFAPATLETLVDSPMYMGAHEHVVPLVDAGGMTSEVDLFGEAAADVDPTSEQVAKWKNPRRRSRCALRRTPLGALSFFTDAQRC